MGGRLPLGLPIVRKKSSKSLICFKWNIHIEHLRHSSTHWFLLRTSVMVAVRCGRGQERRHSGYPSSSRLLVTLCIMILKPLQPDSWVWLSRSPSFSLSRLSRSAAPNLSLSLPGGGVNSHSPSWAQTNVIYLTNDNVSTQLTKIPLLSLSLFLLAF